MQTSRQSPSFSPNVSAYQPVSVPQSAAPEVLKLRRLWGGGDFGFSDMSACDDYYVEPPAGATADKKQMLRRRRSS